MVLDLRSSRAQEDMGPRLLYFLTPSPRHHVSRIKRKWVENLTVWIPVWENPGRKNLKKRKAACEMHAAAKKFGDQL